MSGIPLTVIGGFLGAGKTTLVNRLLQSATRRWGVLVNDFGAINIDAALIDSRDGDTIALTNGCVCCGMGDDLGAGLARLAARAPAVEHAIIEASGVSDPWRIAQLALVEPGFSLEPIVVVADAVALLGLLGDRFVADTVRLQIAAAEVVALSKTDLACQATLAEVEAAIRAIRPDVRLVDVRHGALSDDMLRFPVVASRRFRADTPPMHEFSTWQFVPPGALDRARLRSVLQALPASVLRIKGFCLLAPEATPYLLQFAAGEWTLSLAQVSQSGLVVIGTRAMPDAEELAALFGAALAGHADCRT
jgi:G3E family GTPase